MLGLALASSLAVGCDAGTDDPMMNMSKSGALIGVSMQSEAGVLLDEIPADARERVATAMLQKPTTFWRERARMQLETTLYRLIFRNLYVKDRGQLPLPPVEQWDIQVQTPQRKMVDGHDLVMATYTFKGTLLSPENEPAKSDPLLASTGGKVSMSFVLPADPELLLERTGFACMNESDFPPNSVDTENARQFYDDTCVGGAATDGCHVTQTPTQSCPESVRANVGGISAQMTFERLAWDAATANKVRVGTQNPNGPQLRALQSGVENNRIVYRYFAAGSCAISEGCVGGSGWRRLLQFDATVQNLGAVPAEIGDVGPTSAVVRNNMVSFSQCHQHMHFNHYGKFSVDGAGQQLGSKRAFCLESTSRYFNNEDTPLNHPYTCHFQGVAAGWGDDYIAGLDCQWVDITPVDTTGGKNIALSFNVNPDRFLCEGKLVRNQSGEPTFEPTEFKTEMGQTENRFVCEFLPGYETDNTAKADVKLPATGGMVDSACKRDLVGEKRNCGFAPTAAGVQTCTPGSIVRMNCSVADKTKPQAIRFCEGSTQKGAIPCTYRDALSVAVAGTSNAQVFLPCPAARDPQETGGRYAIYTAPMVPEDGSQNVTCTVQ